MLAINTRYVFGIKDANYQGFIDGFDRDSSKGKKTKDSCYSFLRYNSVYFGFGRFMVCLQRMTKCYVLLHIRQNIFNVSDKMEERYCRTLCISHAFRRPIIKS